MDFTPIDEWERDYDMYLKLIKVLVAMELGVHALHDLMI